jgi:hypothetical protein
MRALGPSTLILDECHHLLEMWGALLGAVLDVLGEHVFVVGLTATPPDEMAPRERELYERLFGGPPDFEVPTPALVKEGDLAPYQELALLTEPLPREAHYVATQERRFQELVAALLDPGFASMPFIAWLDRRFVRRGSNHGAPISWSELRRREPELAVAALRLLGSRDLPVPEGAAIGEAERRPPTADDWALLLGAYCTESLGRSEDAADRAAWERIRAALPPLGYVLTLDGVRRYASPVDRVLSRSASKFAGALRILHAEVAQLGPDLRALLLCHYETAGVTVGARLRGVLDPDAGSAALLLRVLLGDPLARQLHPILVTGRTVACDTETAAAFQRWAVAEFPEFAHAYSSMPETATSAVGDAVTIEPVTAWWRPRMYVPLVTRYFEAGHSRCLVGTRGLLGEGWDAHRVNVLVDLTTATTTTAVHQVRGRSLRLDAAAPDKVADNRDVVCVMPDRAKGTADYARFVRKHRSYFALTAGGEVESGVSHVDAGLSPFGPPPRERFAALNAEMLARTRQRDRIRRAWRVGEPYDDRAVTTLRVQPRLATRPAPDRAVVASASGEEETRRRARLRVGTAIAGSGTLVVGGAVAGELALGLAGAGAVVAAGTAWAAGPLRILVQRFQPRDSLDDLAVALLAALRTMGEVPAGIGPSSLRLVPQADGYYRCYLADVGRDAAETFVAALDELVGPLAAPRYLIPRYVVDRPIALLGAVALAARARLHRPLARQVAYHAVPDMFSTSRARLAAFTEGWTRAVSPGAAIPTGEPLGAGLLELHRGEEPYARETQLRTLWY